MKSLFALAAAVLVSGCFTPSNATLEKIVLKQRACDASSYAAIDGWFARHQWLSRCSSNSPLPASCEAPGTENNPACTNWAAAEIGKAQDQAVATGIAGSAGWGALGAALAP